MTNQRLSTRGLVTVILTSMLLAMAPAHAKEELTPLTVDASFSAADAAVKGFTIPDSAALKGIKRVAVPVFAVEFIVADNVTATTSGFAATGRASSSQYYKLLGVGQPDFQAITDGLYLRFLDELRASGVEVLDAAQVIATPTYAKLVASGKPAPIVSSSTLIMSPPGMGLYGFATMGGGNSSSKKSVFSAFSDVSAGFAAVGAIGDTIQLANELNASLLEVRMRVNFVKLTDNNQGFFGKMAGSASTTGKSFPSVDNVMMSVQTGPTRSTVTMKHTLTLDAAAFAAVREKAATKADMAGAVAVGLLKMAIGSGDSSSSQEMEVIADPGKCRQVVGDGLNSAGSMLVARMKQER
jgi:hypothetical protein